MHRSMAWGLIVALGLWAAGCDGDSSTTTTGQDGVKPAAKDFGRPIRGQRDLVGSWFALEGGEAAGYEFSESGKVVMSVGSDDRSQILGAVTLDYESMDGGRVRLTQPGGMTKIYTAAIEGDTLTLTPESQPNSPHRFRRLRNQTIAEAQRAEVQRLREQRDKQAAAVRELLKQPKLVIVSAGDLRLTREALDITGGPDLWQGTIHTEGNITMLRQAQVSIAPAATNRPLQVRVDLGNVLGPPGQHPIQARSEVFNAEGEGSSLRLLGQGRQIKSDPAVHGELAASYEKIRAQREAEIAKLTDQFGAYAWLQGGLRAQTAAAAEDKRAMVFERVQGQPGFRFVEIPRAERPNWNQQLAFTQPALVVYQEGKPALMMPGNWLLTPVEQDGKVVLRGRTNYNQDAVYAIAETLSPQEVARRRAEVASYLDSLRGGATFRGRIVTEGSSSYPAGRVLQLTLDQNRAFTGSLAALELGGVWSINGKVAETFIGAVFQIDITGFVTRPPTQMMDPRQRTLLTLDWVNGVPTLSGRMNGGYFPGMAVLTPATADGQRAERQRIVETLSKGAHFVSVQPEGSAPRPVYTLKLDSQSGKVSGNISFGGRLDVQGPSRLSGELAEQDGFVVLKLQKEECAPYRIVSAQQTLWVLAEEQALTLSGLSIAANANPPTPRTVALSQVTEPGDDLRLYRAAVEMGAAFAPPDKPQPGDKVLLVVQGTSRGVNMFFGDGRYLAPPGVAAVHAGLVKDGEIGIVQVTYAQPFGMGTYPASTQNGVTMAEIRRPSPMTRDTPTYTIGKVNVE